MEFVLALVQNEYNTLCAYLESLIKLGQLRVELTKDKVLESTIIQEASGFDPESICALVCQRGSKRCMSRGSPRYSESGDPDLGSEGVQKSRLNEASSSIYTQSDLSRVHPLSTGAHPNSRQPSLLTVVAPGHGAP